MSSNLTDSTRFDRFFLQYYPKVAAFINGIIHDRDEAESLAQDIFLKILEGRISVDNMRNADGYLYTVSRNSALAWLRSKKNVHPLEGFGDTADDNPAPDDELLGRELLAYISRIIDRMPEQQRRVFLMSRAEGLSNDEIATRLNLSKRTVESHLYAAVTELRHGLFLLTLLVLFN